jgi:hypothetical protein
MRLVKLFVLLAALTLVGVAAAHQNPDPGRNLDAKLRPPADGPAEAAGKVEFRQPEDAAKIVYLDVRVRHLLPNRSYYLERATDGGPSLDGVCTGTNWLKLGRPDPAETFSTDDWGAGHGSFWRDLSAVPTGAKNDIYFRVTDAATGGVVLQSRCYQFTVSQ